MENCIGTKGTGNETLTITTSTGAATITLPTGPRVLLSAVKKEIILGASALVSCDESNSSIVLTDKNETGELSIMTLSGRGAKSLGFSQMKASGRRVYPGWALLSRPNNLPNLSASGAPQVNTARYPYFRTPLKGAPVLKVTYVTTGSQCPRCQGTLIENDYRFNVLGDALIIGNEDLLYQSCLKAILTLRGSNPYHQAYEYPDSSWPKDNLLCLRPH